MSFNLLDHRDRLKVHKESRSQVEFICPVCGGNILKVDLKTGKWQCWDFEGDENHKREIRDFLSPPKAPGDRRDEEWQKPPRKAGKTSWVYECLDGEHRIKVDRIDDAGGDKKIFQSYKVKRRWVRAGDVDDALKEHIRSQALPLYYEEILEKIDSAPYLFVVEGEKTADAFRKLGFLATTIIGAKWQPERDYEMFRGIEGKLVICPDRDEGGARQAMKIYEHYPAARWMHANPSSFQWNKPFPKGGGYDGADWILLDGATAPDIEAAIVDEPNDGVLHAVNPDHQLALPPQPQEGSTDLREEILHIVKQELGEGATAQALMALSKRTGDRLGDVKSLYKACLNDHAREQSLREGAKGLQPLLKYARQSIPLESIFPEKLAHALKKKAEAARIDPVMLVASLLPAISTLLGGRTEIIGRDEDGDEDRWTEKAILWTCICAPPSTGKSVAQRAVWAPIKARQNKALDELESKLQRLKELEADWKCLDRNEQSTERGGPMDPEAFKESIQEVRFLFEIGQTEALLRLISELKPLSGVCWFRDEMEGLLKSLDQYSSGKGGESESILVDSWTSGLEISVSRVNQEKSFRLKKQILNLSGGIQPGIAEQQFTPDREKSGFMSRMLLCTPKTPKDFAKWSNVKVSLYPLLDDIYTKIEGIPEKTFRFGRDAFPRWVRRWEALRDGMNKNKVSDPGYSSFLGKQCSYVLRLSMVLHCLEFACGVHDLTNTISLDTLRKAIALSDYFCAQYLLLRSGSEAEGGEDKGNLIKVLSFAEKKGGTVTNREVVSGAFGRKRPKAFEVQEMFDAIASQGLATVDGKKLILLKNDPHDPQIAESQAVKGSQPWITRSTSDPHDPQNPTKSGANGVNEGFEGDFYNNGASEAPNKSVDHVDHVWITRSTSETQAQRGSQRSVDHVDHFQGNQKIEIGSEWSVNGVPVIVSGVSQSSVKGFTVARDCEPSRYSQSLEAFRDCCDCQKPAPDWLRAIAQAGTFVDVGQLVNYVGDPIPALQYYAQPWRVKSVCQGKVICESSDGQVLPKLNQSDFEGIRPQQDGGQPAETARSAAIAAG